MAHMFLFVFHCNYSHTLYRFQNKAKNRQLFIPALHLSCTITLNALKCFPKILIQTAHIPKMLDSAKILPKSSTLLVGRNNVTDRRQDQFAMT